MLRAKLEGLLGVDGHKTSILTINTAPKVKE
jgi:hypothetical protein